MPDPLPISKTDDLSIIFPGRPVKIMTGDTTSITVTVWPAGVIHLRTFSEMVQRIIPKLVAAGVNVTESMKNWQRDLLPQLVPIVVDDLLELLNACVSINLMDPRCPQHILPIVAGEWLLETFGKEEKVRPWIEVVEKVIERMTGKKAELWATLSSFSSRQVTVLTASSGNSSPA